MIDGIANEWVEDDAIPEVGTRAGQGTSGVRPPPGVKPTPLRTPASWFAKNFPNLVPKHGEAVFEKFDAKTGAVIVDELCEDFFAATLGKEGSPDTPVVFMPCEDRFYGYERDDGIYRPVLEPALAGRLSHLLLRSAREAEGVDAHNLEFRLRNSSRLKGVLDRARGILAVDDDFFDSALTELIPCNNGILRLADMELLPFCPEFRRRNKLGVNFCPDAACPTFLYTLLRPALNADDIDLLQRWCGMVLTGTNVAQKLLMITGTAGGGKGTLIRVITAIIGLNNVASLRTRHLADRFELGRLLGKNLLYGADVQESFLNTEGASVLKSLTGGDPITVEFKGSNARPEIVCRFNTVVSCNTLPTIRLEGDADAWRRRLLIVTFRNQRPAREITDLSEQIIAQEGSGVLNWMLEGLVKLRADGWRLTASPEQRRRVDDLLAESDSVAAFVREGLVAGDHALLTATQCYTGYVGYCSERGWRELTRKAFGNVIGELVARQFGLSSRHDINDGGGTLQRGWKGVRLA